MRSSERNLKHHTGIAVPMSVHFSTCKVTSLHVHFIKVEPPSMFVTTSCTRAFLRLHEMVRWRFDIQTQPSKAIHRPALDTRHIVQRRRHTLKSAHAPP